LLDLEAIRELVHHYAHCVWRKDVSGAIDLFTEDGVMDMGDRPAIRGRAALRESYEAAFAGGEFLPYVHNHLIDLAENHASGTCLLDLRATLEGRSMVGSGYYEDRYVRQASAWKFQSRKLTMVHLVPWLEGWVDRSD